MSNFQACDPKIWRARLEAARLVCQQSLIELFPRVKPIRSGIDGLLFFVDCIATDQLTKEELKVLQERVDTFVGADKPIAKLEMLKANVVDYLKSQGRRERAWWLSDAVSDGVVPLLRLDDVVQEFFEASPKSTKEAQVVEILQAVPFEMQVERRNVNAIRIFGSAFSDRKSAKLYKKMFKESLKRDVADYAIKKGWVIPFQGEFCLAWLPEGLKIQEPIVRHYLENVTKLGYQSVRTPVVNPKGINEKFAHVLPAQALWHKRLYKTGKSCEMSNSCAEVPLRDILDPFSTTWPYHDLNFMFMKEPLLVQELNSSLQFMLRTIKMLKVKCEWRLPKEQAIPLLSKGEWSRLVRLLEGMLKEANITPIECNQSVYTPQIEGYFVDALGRRWPGPQLSLITGPLVDRIEGKRESKESKRESKELMIGAYWTLFRSLERWIPLLEEPVSE